MSTTKFTIPNTSIELEVDTDTLEVLTPINATKYGRIKEVSEESYYAKGDDATMIKFSELITINDVTLECLVFDDDKVYLADWDAMKEEHVYSKSER